jgi:nitric oxide reductase NorD protein
MPPVIAAATWPPNTANAANAQFMPATPLTHWLRLLWNRTPPLHLHSDVPYILAGALHLPACRPWQGHCAAAAHGAAHLVYSPTRFDGSGLVPIARSLLALLEDARVEALAMRELPGLARLWRPLHQASVADGNGFEPLMARLARALADPTYADPHPWVQKGRRLFYLDDQLGLSALRTPAELRSAALQLGHDIGQLRLPFNARGYRPLPAYRDDHRWMWAADLLAATLPPPQPAPSAAGTRQDPEESAPPQHIKVTRQPEWDRLIQRLRPDWCCVTELLLPSVPAPVAALPAPAQAWAQASTLSRQLLAPLRTLTRPVAARQRSHDGNTFDLDALVSWCTARRQQLPADGRVFRGGERQAPRSTVWLLIDQSASTAAALDASGRSVLDTAAAMAAAMALALQTLGLRCAVSAFNSKGRHAVRLHTLKRPADPLDDGLLLRLQALRSSGSTRLGAALRQTSAGLAAASGDAGWVLLLSDGQPHDIDVHDPHYLVADARHAVRSAARRAVQMRCLTLAAGAGPDADPDARRIFGAGGTRSVACLADLPQALHRLMR